MKNGSSLEMAKEPPALETVKRFQLGGKGNAEQRKDDPSNGVEAVKNLSPKKTATKQVVATSEKASFNSEKARVDLPREALNHRVRTDIFERLLDEQYFQKKKGGKSYLSDIADEALHIGLQHLERRRKAKGKEA